VLLAAAQLAWAGPLPSPGPVRLASTAPARAAPPLCQLGSVDRASTPSRLCIGCHDGTVTAAGGVALRGEHPVGVHYQAALARRPEMLRPVPAALVLVAGRIECTTCHDGASPERFHIALPMARSALCLSCHAL